MRESVVTMAELVAGASKSTVGRRPAAFPGFLRRAARDAESRPEKTRSGPEKSAARSGPEKAQRGSQSRYLSFIERRRGRKGEKDGAGEKRVRRESPPREEEPREKVAGGEARRVEERRSRPRMEERKKSRSEATDSQETRAEGKPSSSEMPEWDSDEFDKMHEEMREAKRIARPKRAVRRPKPESEPESASEEEDGPFPKGDQSRVDDRSTRPLPLANGLAELPASISRYLFEHQKTGVSWLYSQYAAGVGGILADDMGLGKTVQAVALVAALLGLKGSIAADAGRRRSRMRHAKRLAAEEAEETELGPAVVVVLATTVEAWERAFGEWTICNVAVIQSKTTSQERARVLRLAKFGGYDVILVTRDLAVRLDWSAGPSAYVVGIIDEVHHGFKKQSNVSPKKIVALKDRAKVMFGLTGTPLSNEAFEETYALLSLCTSAKLGEKKEFVSNFKAIENGRKIGADRLTVCLGLKRADEFQKLIGRYCLRRVKEEVLADVLTEKHVVLVLLDLSPLQKRLYKAVTDMADVALLRNAKVTCSCGHGAKNKLDYVDCCGKTVRCRLEGVTLEDYRQMPDAERPGFFFAATSHDGGGMCKDKCCPHKYSFAVVDKLVKIANHPSLLQRDPEVTDPKVIEQQDLFAELVFGKEWLRARGYVRSNQFVEKSRIDDCAKLKTIEILLRQFERGDADGAAKVLIFSRFTSMLDIIQAFVIAKGYTYVRLDGKTPQAKRSAIMNKFNDPDDDVFIALVSTGAGGTGVNLQAANKVIMIDPNWNPANEKQAQDRAYRIGQSRDVTVYRLVSKGTVEELIYLRQVYKQKTNNVAFQGAKGQKGGLKFAAVKGQYKGELFGDENLLKYSEEAFLDKIPMTKKRRPVEPACKGAGLDAIDVNDLGRDLAQAEKEGVSLAEIGIKGARSADHINGDYAEDDDGNGGAREQSAGNDQARRRPEESTPDATTSARPDHPGRSVPDLSMVHRMEGVVEDDDSQNRSRVELLAAPAPLAAKREDPRKMRRQLAPEDEAELDW